MELFQKNENQFQYFIKDVEKVVENIGIHAKKEEIAELKKLIDNFKTKTDDFFREDRRLNIGVVGQVKAGKSSFLNTLLFDGKEILPKAATPKTATLTKMEYAEQNKIVIEYYAEDEWDVLEDNAQVNQEDEVYTSAREIIEMVRKNGINPREYLAKEIEEIEFSSYDDLMAGLNQYVGEDGKYTPIVKAVTLHINKEEFRGLSIVDTPGLNDPIVSRTVRTKEFIEVCDVVFFLSQSGSFLDKSDWILLSSQLPQKGVKRLVLLASKYDSGIRDVLRLPSPDDDIFGVDPNTATTIADACKLIQRKLTKRARQKTEEFVKDLENRNSSKELISVISQCSEPILVSALSENMSKKSQEELSKEEENIYKALSKFSQNMQEDLKLLGNFEKIRQLFGAVVEEKENILEQKSKTFVPNAKEELRDKLSNFKERASKRLSILKENDKEQLTKQKEEIEKQISSIKSEILSVFHDLNTRLETEKAECVRDVRAASRDYASVQERSGTKTVTRSYTVSDSKWYNPFSWGKSHTEYSTYDEHYSYCLAADAVENISKFAKDAVGQVEKVFVESIQLKELKRRLLEVVIHNFDTGSESYDAGLVRLMVEEPISQIDFPFFKMDIEEDMRKISSKFSGEITSGSEKNELIIAMNSSISAIFDRIAEKLSEEVVSFKKGMMETADKLQNSLLTNINEEFTNLLEQYNNKEKEIASYQEYTEILEQELKNIV